MNRLSILALLLTLSLVGGATVRAQAPSSPELSRARYQTISSHLDTGGDLMIVANVGGVVDQLVETVRSFASLAQGPHAGHNPAQTALDHLPAYVKSSGINAIDGLGLSLVPRSDGLNDIKLFICREPAAANLPLWRATVGGAPQRLLAPEYLPADTVIARVGTGEPQQLWKLVTDAVQQMGGPQALLAFNQTVASAVTPALGTNLETVVASLGNEAFISLQLSTNQTMNVPLPNAGKNGDEAGLTIPLPSLLIGIAVRDDTLSTALQHLLTNQKAPVICSQAGATTLYSINVPAPMPMPFSPTFAVQKGLFLLGSTPDVVKAAIAAAEGQGGLGHTPAYQKAFAGLPAMNNGLAYIDPRFYETLTQVQTRLLATSAPDADASGLLRLLRRNEHGLVAIVFVNEKAGVAVSGTTSAGGREIALTMSVAPVAMLSAIAIPSFMKSRQVAQQSSCINNLRIIDHAKEQWALANNKNEGDAVTMADIQPYLKQVPVCPQGGKYTLGAIGTEPTCSHAGHVLP